MEKLLDRLWDGLAGNPLSTVAALIIFLLALPLIRAGIYRPPAAPPGSTPPPSPGTDVDPRWLIPNLMQMQSDVAELRREIGELSARLEQLRRPFWTLNAKVDAIAKLLRRRAARLAGRKPD